MNKLPRKRTIADMAKTEGEEVRVGETLAAIDDRQDRLEVARLEAELEEVRRPGRLRH